MEIAEQIGNDRSLGRDGTDDGLVVTALHRWVDSLPVFHADSKTSQDIEMCLKNNLHSQNGHSHPFDRPSIEGQS